MKEEKNQTEVLEQNEVCVEHFKCSTFHYKRETKYYEPIRKHLHPTQTNKSYFYRRVFTGLLGQKHKLLSSPETSKFWTN